MIRCIAIDDEPLALLQIEQYIKDTPILEFKGGFNSAIKALEYLRNNRVDLLFVDINMPRISGLEFIEVLPYKARVIFVTAHREFAMEGFVHDVADYLLKPLSHAAFLKSIEKVHNRYFNDTPGSKERDYTFIRSGNRTVRINFQEIQYIESKREYLDVTLRTGDVITTHGSMASILSKLPSDKFIKVHRSFIVNLEEVTIIERNSIIFGKQHIPINEQAREIVQQFIKDTV